MTHKIIKTNNYLLVVDESVTPVTDGNYYYADDCIYPSINCKYVFAKKILAHLPLGNLYFDNLPLLPPYSRHQEDGIEKKSVDFVREIGGTEQQRLAFKDGYLEAREKYKYTEEDMRKAIDMARLQGPESFLVKYKEEDIIQSLQYPTEFETIMEYNIYTETDTPKTTTTSQGIQWVGKYKNNNDRL